MRYIEMVTPRKTEIALYKAAQAHLLSKGLNAGNHQKSKVTNVTHIRIQNSLKDIENVVRQMTA